MKVKIHNIISDRVFSFQGPEEEVREEIQSMFPWLKQNAPDTVKGIVSYLNAQQNFEAEVDGDNAEDWDPNIPEDGWIREGDDPEIMNTVPLEDFGGYEDEDEDD